MILIDVNDWWKWLMTNYWWAITDDYDDNDGWQWTMTMKNDNDWWQWLIKMTDDNDDDNDWCQ